MARALTTRAVEKTKPGLKRREIPDRHMPGLYLVVQPQPSGAKGWAVRYRHAGVPRKHTLGAYPAIDLKAARDLASKALRAVAEGRDPGREKIQERAAKPDTVETVARQFIERHCKRSNRPRTARETQRLPSARAAPLAYSIGARDHPSRYPRSARPHCRRWQAHCRQPHILGRAQDVQLGGGARHHHCIAMRRGEAADGRAVARPSLDDFELRAVWHAANKVGGPFGALVQLLIVTGQRRDEVAQMRWAEIDLDGRLWTLAPARVKNDQPHDVPLSDSAIAILQVLPRIGNEYVLTTNGEAPSSNYAKNKRRLDALLPDDMPPWRLHDLRRTAASGMARLGVNLPIIEKVLNHSSGVFAGIVGVYQKHTFADEKRQALQNWGAFVDELVSGRSHRNVVRLGVRP